MALCGGHGIIRRLKEWKDSISQEIKKRVEQYYATLVVFLLSRPFGYDDG